MLAGLPKHLQPNNQKIRIFVKTVKKSTKLRFNQFKQYFSKLRKIWLFGCKTA